jgi:hypothetical protein
MAQGANEILSQAYGDDHWRTAWAKSLQGAALAKLERFEEAEPIAVAAYEALRINDGARPVHIDTARQRVVDLYLAWDRPERAGSFAEAPDDQ